MKRQDYVLFFVLIGLLFAWPNVYKKYFADKTVHAKTESAAEQTNVVDDATAPEAEDVTPAVNPAEEPAAKIAPEESEIPAVEESRVELANDSVRLVFSSRGAALVEATLVKYREARAKDSDPVTFDFSARSSLAYSGIPGLTEKNDFRIQRDSSKHVVLERSTSNGLTLHREITVGDNYLITVADTFINESSAAMDLGRHLIRTGAMPEEHAHSDMVGMVNMGVDSLPPASSVENWGKKIPGQFKVAAEELGLAETPVEITFKPSSKPADWVAAKNKYFVQILMPDGEGADWFEIYAHRALPGSPHHTNNKTKGPIIDAVAANLGFDSQTLAPGEKYTRTFEYYIGPKNYGILSKLSHGRDGAMGFEETAYLDIVVVPTAKLLLRFLNFIHDHIYANYGFAIILLTFIVKVVFWPVTHKSTESMRRMASVQPLMAEVKEKYKDNPQKMQQAMMALYKEHKINPMGGCLPMLIQVPVFIALFVVLRIAIELRFAEFLWIHDLSAPERLIEFGFALPLLGWDALNILPLMMTITMMIQQKLTPAAGDPQQQKIMQVMMPLMMLFFLYNFAAGLALYWTTQNTLMIVQQLIYQQRKKRKALAGG